MQSNAKWCRCVYACDMLSAPIATENYWSGIENKKSIEYVSETA